MKELETFLRRDMKEMEFRLKNDLTLRFWEMMAPSTAVIAVLVKLLPGFASANLDPVL